VLITPSALQVDLLASLLTDFDHLNQLGDDMELSSPILYLGTYRHEEVIDDDIFLPYLESLVISPVVTITHVQLRSLSVEMMNSMLARAMKLPTRLTKSLSKITHAKTLGNVFYMKEFLKCLIFEKKLRYSLHDKRWTWNIEEVKQTLIDEDIAELLTANIEYLSSNVIDTLQMVSCFGSYVDAAILRLLPNNDEVISILEAVISKDNIIEKHHDRYHFAHDILLAQFYQMMTEEEQVS
jgi:predicted ATPase